MKQKRAEQRKEKKKVLNPNTDVTEKPKKIRNLAQHYKKLKRKFWQMNLNLVLLE
ncbi:hypothetical protein HMPREF1230_0666 [Streptococcus pyogenes GA19681]|nr:hypothetical protein HMPREF1230_0666 [Streptococcus pyogenes GA19681]